MNHFKDFGITIETKAFTGDKIKIERILNREIQVYDYKIEDSNFKGKCLHMQIGIDNTKRLVFTGSQGLIDMIQKVPPDKFPFKTTIVRQSEHFEFT